MSLWRRIPAKYEAFLESALRRALEDVDREKVPAFAVDDKREGNVVVSLGMPEKTMPARAD